VKYIFIINPIAGNDDKARFMSRIKSAFRENDDEMIIEETQASGDARNIAARYAKEYGGECVVVACGGDGTVHEIANGLAFTETPMMVLPFGTGNDFAKKIYNTKKTDLEQTISKFGLFGGKPDYEVKPIDVIEYNGEICNNVMSFGLDTLVAALGKKMFDKAPFLGHQAYNLAVMPILMKPLHYDISYDITCVDKKTGEEYKMQEINKDYALFAICNASYYGGGFCPAPNSKLDDGLLDFALIDGISLFQALPMIPKYSAGTANEETCGEIFHTGYIKSGRIWSEDGSPLPGNCDGEMFDFCEVNFAVKEKALKLCFIK
jgi:diacylglycerol kinase family enzyme